MTISTDESMSQNQTKSVTIPNLSSVISVTTNTGNVSYTKSGETLDFSLSNGTSTRQTYNSTKFSMYATGTQYSSSSSSSSFASTIPYSSGGYSGTLYQSGSPYYYSGGYVPSQSMYVSGQSSSYYNSGGYSGNLTSYLAGGSYTASDSKTVDGQTSSYYNSGGYSGSLSEYVYSGSYTAPLTKTATGTASGSFTCSWTWDGSYWNEDGGHSYSLPSSISYNSGGYSGTLSLSGKSHTTCAALTDLGGKGSYKGQHGSATKSATGTYSGTVTKPGSDTRVYRYKGTVTKPAVDTRYYLYAGTVTSSAYDNTTYAQSYSGTAYAGGYDNFYKYSVTIKYWNDAVAPVLNLSYDNSGIYNTGIISATATDAGSGMSRIQLPNGNWVAGSTTSYTVKDNGVYTFIAEDFAGNQTTKSIDVSNIDNQNPLAPTVTVNENWTKGNVVATMSHNGDLGASGVKQVEYSLTGASSQGWTTYTNPITIATEGITTLSVRVLDKAGNYSTIVTKTVKIDKSTPNLVVTPNILNLTNTDIVLSATASDSLSGMKRIQLPDGNWITGSSVTYTVAVNGTYTFKAEDQVGNITTFESVVRNIKKNVLITNKREVLLDLYADDIYSGVDSMQMKNEEESSWSAWEPYKTLKDWVLPPVDGLKHVWVKYRDKVGNISTAIEDIIILDMTKPTVSSLTINDGDVYTKSAGVKLQVKGTDVLSGVKEIYISNDNTNWTKKAYADEVDWTLSTGDGTKTVYVKISDNAGNLSNVITDTIFLDSTKPLTSILINKGDSYTPTRDVKLTLTYSDTNGSGIETVKVIEGDKEYILPKPTPNSPTTIDWTLDFGAVRTVSIIAIDKAGNVSNLSSDEIIVDKLTLKAFTLENVVNPLVFNSKQPFKAKVWEFESQPMLAGGNITFSVDIKEATDSTMVSDKVEYKVDVIGVNGYHKVFMGEMAKKVNHYTQTITLPKDAPNGSKVNVSAVGERKLLVSPYDTQKVYFPGVDASSQAQIGTIGVNILDTIQFNETH